MHLDDNNGLPILITFANSLDQDQDQQNVGPDLVPNHLTLIVFLKVFLEKVNFEKQSAEDFKSMKNYLERVEMNLDYGGKKTPVYQAK